jgi:hypothetical protein
MTAVSFQLSRGFEATGMQMSSVTVGTNAPAGGDFEFRFNVLDSSPGTKNINDADIWHVIEAFKNWIITNSGALVGTLRREYAAEKRKQHAELTAERAEHEAVLRKERAAHNERVQRLDEILRNTLEAAQQREPAIARQMAAIEEALER